MEKFVVHPEFMANHGNVHDLELVCRDRLPALFFGLFVAVGLFEVSSTLIALFHFALKIISLRSKKLCVAISIGLAVAAASYSGYLGYVEVFGFSLVLIYLNLYFNSYKICLQPRQSIQSFRQPIHQALHPSRSFYGRLLGWMVFQQNQQEL